MYYSIRVTTSGDYPCTDYFEKQLIVLENEDSNRHYQGIVFTEKSKLSVNKFLQRKVPGAYSFVVVRNPKACHKYFVDNPEKGTPNIVINTIGMEDLKVFFQSATPKVSHKKGETFIAFVLNTYEIASKSIVFENDEEFNNFVDSHIISCYKEKRELISKISYRRIRQTLIINFHNDYIPDSWKCREI